MVDDPKPVAEGSVEVRNAINAGFTEPDPTDSFPVLGCHAFELVLTVPSGLALPISFLVTQQQTQVTPPAWSNARRVVVDTFSNVVLRYELATTEIELSQFNATGAVLSLMHRRLSGVHARLLIYAQATPAEPLLLFTASYAIYRRPVMSEIVTIDGGGGGGEG